MGLFKLLVAVLLFMYVETDAGSTGFLNKFTEHQADQSKDRGWMTHRRTQRIHENDQDSDELHGRSKRAAFIVEGTVWCGIGDKAQGYTDLGVHRETDLCCRDHDHCPNMIGGLSWDFGIFNYRPYTINLCSCDESFRQCLVAANTTLSRRVGQFFFDTLRPVCFELSTEPTEQCTRRAWWGLCLEYGLQRTAIVGTNKQFNGTELRSRPSEA